MARTLTGDEETWRPCPTCGGEYLGESCPCVYRESVPGEEELIGDIDALRRDAESADRRCRAEWGAANVSLACWETGRDLPHVP